MDWTNRFTLGGFTVTYSTFQMAWEVVEKRDGYEVAFRWFPSRKKAEANASGRLQQIEARPVTKPASFAAQSSIETSIGNFEEKLKTRRPLKILVAGETTTKYDYMTDI